LPTQENKNTKISYAYLFFIKLHSIAMYLIIKSIIKIINMEQQNDFTFEYGATIDRFYSFFSDLLDKELNKKDDTDFQDSNK
jgi:hypothetical protein